MAKIKAKETRFEIAIRKELFALGYRYRKNVKTLPGTPDIVLPKYKTTIFINGCFWHGHNCKYAALPQTNRQFWEQKINSNIVRDKRNLKELRKLGWATIVVWQCKLKTQKQFVNIVNQIVSKLKL